MAQYESWTQLADLVIVLLSWPALYSAGVRPVASYAAIITWAQRERLSATRLPLGKVVLHREDEAASVMLQTVRRQCSKRPRCPHDALVGVR